MYVRAIARVLQEHIMSYGVHYQDQRGSIYAPAHPVDLVEILLYFTKLDSKSSQGVKHHSSFMYNLRDSVLDQGLRSENNTIMVSCLHRVIHRQPVSVATNGTTFGSCDQHMNYSDEGKIRYFYF